MSMRVAAFLCLVAAMSLGGCSSSEGSSAGSAGPGPSTVSSGSRASTVGCPLSAAAVSVALKSNVADISNMPYQASTQPALCVFQTSFHPGLTVQIFAFPLTEGRDKNLSLASIKDELRSAAGKSKSLGLTYQIVEHPEWGTDAFTLLEHNSGHPAAVEVWTAKYSSAIEDASDQLSDAAYLADASNLGDALVHASK